MINKHIFTIDELRTITDAGFNSRKNHEVNWVKYTLTPVGNEADDAYDAYATEASEAYERYLFNLTDRGRDYFEECMDVAVDDCWEAYKRLAEPGLTEAQRKELNSEINGWIEAAFDEFLE